MVIERSNTKQEPYLYSSLYLSQDEDTTSPVDRISVFEHFGSIYDIGTYSLLSTKSADSLYGVVSAPYETALRSLDTKAFYRIAEMCGLGNRSHLEGQNTGARISEFLSLPEVYFSNTLSMARLGVLKVEGDALKLAEFGRRFFVLAEALYEPISITADFTWSEDDQQLYVSSRQWCWDMLRNAKTSPFLKELSLEANGVPLLKLISNSRNKAVFDLQKAGLVYAAYSVGAIEFEANLISPSLYLPWLLNSKESPIR